LGEGGRGRKGGDDDDDNEEEDLRGAALEYAAHLASGSDMVSLHPSLVDGYPDQINNSAIDGDDGDGGSGMGMGTSASLGSFNAPLRNSNAGGVDKAAAEDAAAAESAAVFARKAISAIK
jgi:hypothetical protein